MLHILLLILKIIGIILAAILGILLLLIGIVLFVPICYEISAKCDDTIESLRAKISVTWLLHLLRADVFVKGKKLKWKIRAAWIKKSSALGFGEQKGEQENEAKKEKSDETIHEIAKEDNEAEIPEENTEILEEKCEESSNEFAEHRMEKTREENTKTDADSSVKSKKESLSDKFTKLIAKIKTSIEKFCDKIKEFLQKKEKITEFLTKESHVRAFKKVKKALIIFLKRLKPKKTNIKLQYGFDDPGTTGRVLAGLSVLYPFLGDTTEIIPDFENRILKGKVYLKGRIRLCHLAWMALKLLLSKDVRVSYKDIRNFKL